MTIFRSKLLIFSAVACTVPVNVFAYDPHPFPFWFRPFKTIAVSLAKVVNLFNTEETDAEFCANPFRLAKHLVLLNSGNSEYQLKHLQRYGSLPSIVSVVGWCNDVNAADSNGNTVVMDSKTYAYPSKVKLLTSRGANFDYQNNNGQTALMRVVIEGSLPQLRTLVSLSPNMNIKDNWGRTALILAAMKKSRNNEEEIDIEEKIDILSKHGACRPTRAEIEAIQLPDHEMQQKPDQFGVNLDGSSSNFTNDDKARAKEIIVDRVINHIDAYGNKQSRLRAIREYAQVNGLDSDTESLVTSCIYGEEVAGRWCRWQQRARAIETVFSSPAREVAKRKAAEKLHRWQQGVRAIETALSSPAREVGGLE